MRNDARVAVIIPALNEKGSIGKVLDAIPDWVDLTVVVDNGSEDGTAEVAVRHGANVVAESARGYGAACLKGIASLEEFGAPDIVVFLDADYSDYPEEMERLADPILEGRADMVIGSRSLGRAEPGALTPQQRFGNWLATFLLRLIWGARYTDLGPFRAISYAALGMLDMQDRNYGWTVEMQIRGARRGLRGIEVPVSYRKRIGVSKISGTVRGVLAAGSKILSTIFVHAAASLFGFGEKMPRERLIVFTRFPEPGKTKTRLIPALGPEGAAELQRMMTEHFTAQARRFAEGRDTAIEIRHAGGGADRMARWLGSDFVFRAQSDGDLGRRMLSAFRGAFAAGADRAVTAGADCPLITPEILRQAFDRAADHDLVLGPSRDGGYYLIGLRRAIAELFEGIAWGTGEVFDRTMAIAKSMGLSVALLETLDDVDRPEDLHIWEKACKEAELPPLADARISVVIPALNEAEGIETTLNLVLDSEGVEAIVADGGSTDATAEAARALGAKVIDSDKGIAKQMNAGAAEASGDILLFLHADTYLPAGYAGDIRRALGRAGVVAGAFELEIEAEGRPFRRVERYVNWRSRARRMPYGDQGLFLRADLFVEIGGFPEIAIMEDYEILRRLRSRGGIYIIPRRVRTSARRWEEVGVWRASIFNQAAVILYRLGVAPERIARWYRKGGKRKSPAPETETPAQS